MKKNKKLFAILTLVAFMMTLMPVMAFADPVVANTVNVTNVQLVKSNGYITIVLTRDNNEGIATAQIVLKNVAADKITVVENTTSPAALRMASPALKALSDTITEEAIWQDGEYKATVTYAVTEGAVDEDSSIEVNNGTSSIVTKTTNAENQ